MAESDSSANKIYRLPEAPDHAGHSEGIDGAGPQSQPIDPNEVEQNAQILQNENALTGIPPEGQRHQDYFPVAPQSPPTTPEAPATNSGFWTRGKKIGAAATAAVALLAGGFGIKAAGGHDTTPQPSASAPLIPGQTGETTPAQSSTAISSPEVSSTLNYEAIFNLPPEQQSEKLDTLSPDQLRQAFSITTASSPEDYAQQYIKRFEALQNAGCSPKKMSEYMNDNHNDPSGYNGYMLDHFVPAAEALNGPGYNKDKFYTINRIGMAASCTAQATVKKSVPSVNDFYETFKIVPGSIIQTEGTDGWNFTFKTEDSSTLTESDLAADNQYLNHAAGNYGIKINEWTFTGVRETNGSYLPLKSSTKPVTN